MAYEHLRLERESPVTDRHRPRGFGGRPPADPRGHGNALLRSFRAIREVAANEDVGGFDDRKLLKIRLREGERQLPDFSLIDGLEDYVAQLDLQRVSGATHWLLHEQPERVRALLHEFICQ